MTFSAIIPWLYMGFFMAVGWRLYIVGWPLRIKALAGAVMVLAPPLLVILPALHDPASPAAGTIRAISIAMLLMGALCLTGGAAATWLRERARGKR